MSQTPTPDGVPAERTLLAWRRTALTVAVVATVGIRFAAATLGPVTVAVGAAGIGLSLLAYAGAAARYRQLGHTATGTGSVGSATTALAGATVLIGLTAFGWLLFQG